MYLDNSYKNPFDRKSPATCGSSFQSSRQVGVLFCLRIFHEIASSHFVAIFGKNFALVHRFLLCFAQVRRRWLYEKCAKSQRHLWTGCTSSCHPELDSGSINAKKFQNFFIVFAKKCNFFSIINMYKKNLFLRRENLCLRNLKI